LPEFINENPKFYEISKDTLAIGPGIYLFKKDVIFPNKTKLIINPGTTIYLEENVSFVLFNKIIAKGTAQLPIRILPSTENPWGSIVIIGSKNEKSELEFINISGGSGFQKFGINTTGMLSIHNGDAIIKNSNFEKSMNDDAVNIKDGYAIIESNTFSNTSSDAIDLDNVNGSVINNTFLNIGKDIGGDALDISFSAVNISGNKITICSDKGISIGEKSYPILTENIISQCHIGISVKDLSRAEIEKAYLFKNNIGIELKQKKPIFGGGSATLKNSILWKNDLDITIDPFSQLEQLESNLIESDGIEEPDFKELLPVNFYEFFE
ncbi:right-handed parallel beta-helix repeat-containing protein, partial [Patescibacteria group bacterium]